MIRTFFIDGIRFFLLVIIQILILNNINLGGLINPYLYILFILLLPFEIPGWLLLLLSMFTGFIIDYFSHQHGLHMVACLLMGFLRPMVLKAFTPREGYEKQTEPSIFIYGVRWFIKYVAVLTLIHHFALFYLEIFRFSDFFITLLRVLVSSFFTILLVVISQYLFARK